MGPTAVILEQPGGWCGCSRVSGGSSSWGERARSRWELVGHGDDLGFYSEMGAKGGLETKSNMIGTLFYEGHCVSVYGGRRGAGGVLGMLLQ